MNPMALTILAVTAVVIAMVACLPKLLGMLGRPLRVGDQIELAGGHQDPAPWLGGKTAVTGLVSKFSIDDSAVAVTLENPLVFDGTSYTFALLRLHFANARWTTREVVHVELWPEMPVTGPAAGGTGPSGKWVESHASYRVIKQ